MTRGASYNYVRIDYEEHLDGLEDDVDVSQTDTVASLEATLTSAFAATQAKVHVITGKLKASGRITSSVGSNSWEGTITYGGPGTGVEYAWYEQRRGGVHDYMEPSEGLDDEFADAIENTIGDRDDGI